MVKLVEPSRKWGISRGFGNGHNGIDYKYPEGTPVTAAAAGTVGFEGWGQNDPWTLELGGIYVRIQHSDGSWTGYAHLSRTVVNKGQKVEAGQVIGYSGHTGLATGPHLHFEVIPKKQDWNNGYSARINPAPFFQKATPKPAAPSRKSAKGTATVLAAALNVRDSPTTKAKVVATYKKGQTFKYDSYVVANGFVWLSYISTSGKRRYVAEGPNDGKENTVYVRGGV